MKLIYGMLISTQEDGSKLELLLEFITETKTEKETVSSRDYVTDYTLAALIYSSFNQTAEEVAIQEEGALSSDGRKNHERNRRYETAVPVYCCRDAFRSCED